MNDEIKVRSEKNLIRGEMFLEGIVTARGRDEETNRITQSHKGRSKIKIVSEQKAEPQAN